MVLAPVKILTRILKSPPADLISTLFDMTTKGGHIVLIWIFSLSVYHGFVWTILANFTTYFDLLHCSS